MNEQVTALVALDETIAPVFAEKLDHALLHLPSI
jgi:hypothetical protein